MLWLLVAFAAGSGAVARHAVSLVAMRMTSTRTLGTVVVNISGSLLAGAAGAASVHAIAVAGPPASTASQLIVAGGFLGSFTTMSAAMVELAESVGPWNVARAVVEPLAAVSAASLGWLVVTALA